MKCVGAKDDRMTATREFAVDCYGNSSHLGIPGLYKLFRFAVVTERKREK